MPGLRKFMRAKNYFYYHYVKIFIIIFCLCLCWKPEHVSGQRFLNLLLNINSNKSFVHKTELSLLQIQPKLILIAFSIFPILPFSSAIFRNFPNFEEFQKLKLIPQIIYLSKKNYFFDFFLYIRTIFWFWWSKELL